MRRRFLRLASCSIIIIIGGLCKPVHFVYRDFGFASANREMLFIVLYGILWNIRKAYIKCCTIYIHSRLNSIPSASHYVQNNIVNKKKVHRNHGICYEQNANDATDATSVKNNIQTTQTLSSFRTKTQKQKQKLNRENTLRPQRLLFVQVYAHSRARLPPTKTFLHSSIHSCIRYKNTRTRKQMPAENKWKHTQKRDGAMCTCIA